MKRRHGILWLSLALALATCSCAATYATSDNPRSTGAPDGPIDASTFYAQLSPSGQWFEDSANGWCWTPYDVAADWRPYSNGHWIYTDYGWSWASAEPWGWATEHYGRWFFDDSYGWCWVPGNEWAPAWVAWREGDDDLGWAPLPPSARWDGASGLAFADADAIPSQEWCFVARAHVLDGNLRLQVASVGRNATMLSRSRDATRFEVRNGRPANIGLDPDRVGQFVGHAVAPVRIVDVGSSSGGSGRPANGGVGYYRPALRPMPAGRAPVENDPFRHPDVVAPVDPRARAAQQQRLESDLLAEHRRLAREQSDELRKPPAGAPPEQIRQQHMVEQRAFEAHAAQQRHVLEQRQQKQVGKPARTKGNSRSAPPGQRDEPGRGNDKPGK